MSTIQIVPYSSAWPEQYAARAAELRAALADSAIRIDHIGSTSVPNLPAKAVLDIQVTVQALVADVERRLSACGYVRRPQITRDHVPPGNEPDDAQWEKWFFRSDTAVPPVNLHIRLLGRANQRYALLFRDYLRHHPRSAAAYARVKVVLADYHPENIVAYCDIKDPVCDLIFHEAEEWAARTGWQPEG